MLYEETEKKEIERVYAVFADYIRESPYLEWFWSDKLGYLLLKIGAEKRYIAENVIIYTAEQLARILFSEVSMDVLQMTGNDHTEQTADPLELADSEWWRSTGQSWVSDRCSQTHPRGTARGPAGGRRRSRPPYRITG